VWGQPGGAILSALSERDYEFVSSVPVSRYMEALRLGAEAPWYLALHLTEAGLESNARAMLLLAREHSPEPWRSYAAAQLCRTGTSEEKREAIAIWNRLYPDDPRFDSAHVLLLFQEGKTQDAVTASGASIESWVLDRTSHQAHQYLLPALEPGSDLARVAQLRVHAYRRSWQGAWQIARSLLISGSDVLDHAAVRSDIGRAALFGSTDFAANARLFEALIEQDSRAGGAKSPAAHMADFYAARLWARSGPAGLPAANRHYLNAIKTAPDDPARDNALWYKISVARDEGPAAFLAAMLHSAQDWRNPALFTEHLENLTVALVSAQNWTALRRLYAVLPGTIEPNVYARLAYLAGRAAEMQNDDGTALFEKAYRSDHGTLYYRALAAQKLGVAIASPAQALFTRRTPPKSIDATQARAVLTGYIRFGLAGRVLSVLRANWAGIPLELGKELAASVAEAGYIGDSMRIIAFVLQRSDEAVTDEALRLAYPRPWQDEVTEAAQRFGLPEYLLYALMRTESFFQSDVVSRAGAVGLSQLMPTTASDIARKLRITDYDLTDPKTNITFGAFYLAELIRRLDGRILPALFAYNAGMTRVRTWQRASPSFSEDLFLETIPFLETRDYGRMVVAAMAVYGYLYYERDSKELIEKIFR